MSPLRGVLFDMDGLLLDTERVGMLAFQDIVEPLGMETAAADAFYLTLIGTSNAHTRTRLAEAFGIRAEGLDEQWRDRLMKRMATGVPLRPGAHETVWELARKGHPMAVVTSTGTDRARHHLAEADLLAAFVDVIGGDRVAANKPDPAPYLQGASRVGRAPGDCVAFEDSDTGTRSARAAGCQVWQIPDLRPPGLAFPDLGQNIASSLSDAARLAGL